MVCPYGAIDVFSDMGHSFKCDLCGGDPKCVKACQEGALKFVEETRESREKQRKIFGEIARTIQLHAETIKYEEKEELDPSKYREWADLLKDAHL